MGVRVRRLIFLTVALAAVVAAAAMPIPPAGDPFAPLRHRMVEEQVKARDVKDAAVLAAMEAVPRHLFVPESERGEAYADHPLPIGGGQTISQPYIVALMTELLGVGKHGKVLEIGTGSGYHAAVLSRVVGEVYSMEIVPSLGEEARATLARLGYDNIHVRVGDGYKGWPEEAPFDAILLTAAPPSIPEPLLAQLKPGGRMVLPVGTVAQDLLVLTKRPDGTVETRNVLPVRFVPMTGEAQGRR
ncbi:MAG: protein-L-isoaspartate(D-aspartate) O-methyltransferase [Acidobacteriota bacterium]|jgi:protein-L-isoaspartate(D-aspartate) O-methyltransferase|nr:protein-L-isoaspartate(D-aspartate) O-methyltransferase [Acidobacteriota bacterium]